MVSHKAKQTSESKNQKNEKKIRNQEEHFYFISFTKPDFCA